MGLGFHGAKAACLTGASWHVPAFSSCNPSFRHGKTDFLREKEGMRMLQVKKLTITHKKDLTALVEDLSLIHI